MTTQLQLNIIIIIILLPFITHHTLAGKVVVPDVSKYPRVITFRDKHLSNYKLLDPKIKARIRPTAQGHSPDDFNLLCSTPSRFFCALQRELLELLTPPRVNGVLHVTMVAAMQRTAYSGAMSYKETYSYSL